MKQKSISVHLLNCLKRKTEQEGQREAVFLERKEGWEVVNSSCNLNRILIFQQLLCSLVHSAILLQVALRIH